MRTFVPSRLRPIPVKHGPPESVRCGTVFTVRVAASGPGASPGRRRPCRPDDVVGRAPGSGERRPTTPITQATPPETTANCGVVRAATTAASMSPRRGPLVTTRVWIDVHPAAELVGRLELDERRAEDGREDVGGTGHGEEDQRQRERERSTSPNAVIARPQTTTASRIARPVRRTELTQPENRAPRKAPAAGAAASSPKPAGPVPKTLEGQDREERGRHPEDHRVEVDDERAEDRPALRAKRRPSRIASSPGRTTTPIGGSGWMASERDERRDERDEVDRVGAGEADRRDEDPADRRADDRGQLEVELVERDRRRAAVRAGRGAGSPMRGPAGRPRDSPAATNATTNRASDRRRAGQREQRRARGCTRPGRSGSRSAAGAGRRHRPATRRRARTAGSG